jgi:acyl-CoA thioester hydrolase
MTPIYTYNLVVTDEVVDLHNHVNNVVYVRWMQEAAASHSEEVGGNQATREAGAIWVVRSHKIEYLRPAFTGDRIQVQTWVSTLETVRSLRKYKFIRPDDHTLLARAETDWVFLDSATGRPRMIPVAVAQRFTVIPPSAEP